MRGAGWPSGGWLAALVMATGAAGQEAPARAWDFDGEIGASLLFGATEQATLLSRARYGLEVPSWELGLGGSFDYGEANEPEGGRFVSNRAWSLQGSADYQPEGTFSPFVFVTAQGSLQRQIDSRVSGGAGARLRFIDRDDARVDVSLAVLIERTDARMSDPGEDDVTSIGRWSTRFRARRTFDEERMTVDLVSFFKPRMDDTSDYTVEVTAGLQYALTSVLGLKLSLVDTYDSLARDRGALSNNDGRLLFSVIASVK